MADSTVPTPTTATTTTMSTCKVLLAGTLAKPLSAEVAESLANLGRDRRPKLVGFLTNTDDADARAYADWTSRSFGDNGFDYELRTADKDELEEAILNANRDDEVDGIIVYYPIFRNRQDQYIQQLVDPAKDVEALGHRYLFNLYQNIRYLDGAEKCKSLLPCTPLAMIKILEELKIYNPLLAYGQRLYGKTVTVINRSEVVGRPLAALLANDGARVFSVDIDSVQEFTRGPGLKQKRHQVTEKPGWTVENCLPLSDVVITGVPGDSYKVPVDLVKEGATCINFSSQKVRTKKKRREIGFIPIHFDSFRSIAGSMC